MINNNVILGDDGWLFLNQGSHHQMDYLLGNKKVTSLSVDNFNMNLNRRHDYLAGKGIKYAHVVFPSKPVVCKSFLPLGLRAIESLYLNNYYRTDVVYSIDSLCCDDYFKTDTHMNGKGSWIVLLDILSKLKIDVGSLSPSFTSFFKLGDLNAMLSQTDREMSWALDFINEKKKIQKFNNLSSLKGNEGRIFIHSNNEALSKKRVLIFGDSFITLMLDHFSYIFEDVFFVRSSEFNINLVEMYSPDIVITANAERYLANVSKEKSNEPFLLKYLDARFYALEKQDLSYFEALLAQLSYSSNNDLYRQWKDRFSNESKISQ